MKKISLVFTLLLSVSLLSACSTEPSSDKSDLKTTKTQKISNKIEIINDMCKEFDVDFIYSAIGKSIAYFDQGALSQSDYCQYYTQYKTDFYKLPNGSFSPGGPWIAMKFSDGMDVANQKKGAEVLGRKISTNENIKMENFIVLQDDDQINSIYLVFNPTRYILISRSSIEVITNDEMIILAKYVAEKIAGNLSIDIKKNPVELSKTENTEVITENNTADSSESKIDIAQNFISYLGQGDVSGALSLMDANSQTKTMWETNFKTIKSITLVSIDPIYQDEWTGERQVYKAVLDVQVALEGEQYGWQNGENNRWITIQKTGESWLIHEIANNP